MKTQSASGGKFSKILFAVDGSPHSTGAVDAVATIAKASKAEVRVLHVLWDVETLTEADELVDGIARQLAAAGVAATPEVIKTAEKTIPDAIAEAARQWSADLVAVGSRGRSDLGGLFLGSVSHRVLHKLSRPVLIVRTPTDKRRGPHLQRVLLAVAGGDEVAQAVEAVSTIALAAGATIRVLHVRNQTAGEGMAWIETEEDAAAIIDTILTRLLVAGVSAETEVAGPSSFVARDIAEAAREWDADLIVMGSRRLSELGGLVAGSINHEVIHLTDRPVLVVEKS